MYIKKKLINNFLDNNSLYFKEYEIIMATILLNEKQISDFTQNSALLQESCVNKYGFVAKNSIQIKDLDARYKLANNNLKNHIHSDYII